MVRLLERRGYLPRFVVLRCFHSFEHEFDAAQGSAERFDRYSLQARYGKHWCCRERCLRRANCSGLVHVCLSDERIIVSITQPPLLSSSAGNITLPIPNLRSAGSDLLIDGAAREDILGRCTGHRHGAARKRNRVNYMSHTVLEAHLTRFHAKRKRMRFHVRPAHCHDYAIEWQIADPKLMPGKSNSVLPPNRSVRREQK